MLPLLIIAYCLFAGVMLILWVKACFDMKDTVRHLDYTSRQMQQDAQNWRELNETIERINVYLSQMIDQ